MCSDVFGGTKEPDHTFEGVRVSIINQPGVGRADFIWAPENYALDLG